MISTPSLACLPAAVILALALVAPVAGQERVPAEPIPVDAWAEPDSVAVPPPAFPGLLPGVVEEAAAPPWIVETPGWFGFTLARYNRIDGAVPAWGLRLDPSDPGRAPAIETRIGLATTHRRLYWNVQARQRVPFPGALDVTLAAFQRGATFDDWKLTTRENDFATFLIGSDLLDWWRERGWSIGLDGESPDGRWGYALRYTDAEQFSQPNRAPFVLFGGDDDFRSNPEVETGDLHALSARLSLDTRDVQSPLLPAPGWLLSADWEVAGAGLGGDLGFSRLALDARRYVRFGRDAWWDHRIVWMGPTDDGTLPPQRRVSLGGPGSLRGFDAMTFADSEALQASTELRLPLPVTDRIAILFLSWHWTLFADVGALGEDYGDLHADVGTGISGINIFSYIGVFVAQRVTDLDRPAAGPRFIVRLRRDF